MHFEQIMSASLTGLIGSVCPTTLLETTICLLSTDEIVADNTGILGKTMRQVGVVRLRLLVMINSIICSRQQHAVTNTLHFRECILVDKSE